MLSVPFNGEQRFGCRVPGLWRMNARDFDDADVSSRSILRSSQPCFPKILECDGHANATRRCSRDKFVLFDIMWLAVILGWNFPSNPEANYSVHVLAECFPADRNPHTLWVGVCEPTLDSRSTPGLSECVDNFDQPTDVDLDSGPGSSWTCPQNSDSRLMKPDFYLFGRLFACCAERGNESSFPAFYPRPLSQAWLVFGRWWRLLVTTEGQPALELLPPPLFTAPLLLVSSHVYTKQRWWS